MLAQVLLWVLVVAMLLMPFQEPEGSGCLSPVPRCPGFPKKCLVSGESSSGISRDDYIGHVAKDIENKMPKVFDLDQVRKQLGIGISPTSVVLLQELERFNKLAVRMAKSLAELQRVRVSLMCRLLPTCGTWFCDSCA